MAEAYRGRVQVATVDLSDEGGPELAERYGAGRQTMAFVYFDRAGQVVQCDQSISEDGAREVLERLLAQR